MSKYQRVIIIFIVILIFSIIVCTFPRLYFSYISRWKYQIENFDSFKSDFESVVVFTKDYFAAKGNLAEEINLIISVGYDVESKNHTLWYEGNSIQISEGLQTSINNIAKKAFVRNLDSCFDRIIYHPNMISFGIANGQYALIYSFDDTKPNFINSSDKKIKICTKKIEKHWYHVAIDH